jgi:DNA polymerase-3 subunit epsilon
MIIDFQMSLLSKVRWINSLNRAKSLYWVYRQFYFSGHHVDFDVEMINAALEKLECGRLKNEALDIDMMHQIKRYYW